MNNNSLSACAIFDNMTLSTFQLEDFFGKEVLMKYLSRDLEYYYYIIFSQFIESIRAGVYPADTSALFPSYSYLYCLHDRGEFLEFCGYNIEEDSEVIVLEIAAHTMKKQLEMYGKNGLIPFADKVYFDNTPVINMGFSLCMNGGSLTDLKGARVDFQKSLPNKKPQSGWILYHENAVQNGTKIQPITNGYEAGVFDLENGIVDYLSLPPGWIFELDSGKTQFVGTEAIRQKFGLTKPYLD